MIKVGVIGCGYWGPNLVRNFVNNEKVNVTTVCDLEEKRLNNIQRIYPFLKTTKDASELIKSNDIDAVAVATPSSSHYSLAKEALENKKHVLVEKPMTVTSDEGKELVELAEKNNMVLMVDHTFVFTSAVKKIKEIYDSGELGEILYYDSVRVNLGLFQPDVNVVWDLAPHDLSIMHYVMKKNIRKVSAIGIGHANPDIENVAYMTVHFDENIIAHFHFNWLSPVKLRLTLIGGSKKMIVYDDMEPTDKIRIYDKGIEIKRTPGKNVPEEAYQYMIGYRIGDIYIPKVEHTEALKAEVSHFVECIEDKKKPVTDGEFGLEIVRMLEAAQRSIKSDGRLEEIT